MKLTFDSNLHYQQDAVIDLKPQKVLALDKLFKGNDPLKTNTSLQMKDAGIEFKTI